MYDNPHWKVFFSQFSRLVHNPDAIRLGGDLLRNEYNTIMHDVLRQITQWN
jgi:hypothetical protein